MQFQLDMHKKTLTQKIPSNLALQKPEKCPAHRLTGISKTYVELLFSFVSLEQIWSPTNSDQICNIVLTL